MASNEEREAAMRDAPRLGRIAVQGRHHLHDLTNATHMAAAFLRQNCGRIADQLGLAGFTYVLGWNDLRKIGRSERNVALRVRELQMRNAAPLTLVGICHDQLWESALHEAFDRHRSHGEFFAWTYQPITMPERGGGPCWGCRSELERQGLT